MDYYMFSYLAQKIQITAKAINLETNTHVNIQFTLLIGCLLCAKYYLATGNT